jgi:hypothetical protein
MNLRHRLRDIFFLLIFFSPATFAGLQFTYQSEALPFIQGYLNGSPDESVGLHEPPYPAFNISGFADIQNNQATITQGDVWLWWEPDNSHLGAFSATESYVRFSPEGTPVAWHLDLQLLKQSDSGPWGPSRDFWRIQSSYGDNSCNCDSLWYEYDLYIQRPFDTWSYAATLGFENGGGNSLANWHWLPVTVPEPWAICLIALGLVSISLLRRRY